MPATPRPRRTPCPFGFTIRLTETQRIHFESVAQAQGHASIAAAFKAQALASGMEHPLQEMRLSLDYMTSRITDESAWLDQHVSDAEPVLLRQQVAKACEQLGQTSKAKAVEQGRTAIVDLKGHRGNSLEGLVLGLSPSSAYVLSGLEVVRVSRRETALNQLDDASAVDLVGKRLRLAIRGGRAVECMGFEMGAALPTKDAKPKDRIAALAPSR